MYTNFCKQITNSFCKRITEEIVKISICYLLSSNQWCYRVWAKIEIPERAWKIYMYLDVFNFERRSRILHAYVSTHPHLTYTPIRVHTVRYTKKSLGSVSPRVAWARRHLFFPRSNNSWGQPFWELVAARSYCSTVTLKPWILYGHTFRTCLEKKALE